MSDSKKTQKTSSGLGTLGAALAERFKLSATAVETTVKSARPSADGKLVYSTDPSLNTKCERCKKLTSDCACPAQETVHDRKIVARLRIEKNGRGGKTVTVIDELPSNDEFLQEWVTRLKKKCGSGGSQHRDERGGVIEIQGDHRETIRKIFQEAGFKTKGH